MLNLGVSSRGSSPVDVSLQWSYLDIIGRHQLFGRHWLHHFYQKRTSNHATSTFVLCPWMLLVCHPQMCGEKTSQYHRTRDGVTPELYDFHEQLADFLMLIRFTSARPDCDHIACKAGSCCDQLIEEGYICGSYL